MSNDPKMRQAYAEGKDLYAVIAQSMFNNEYWENLEFYPEFSEIELDGKLLVSGSGKELTYTLEDQAIEVPWCYLLPTPSGDIPAEELKVGDLIVSDAGLLTICNIEMRIHRDETIKKTVYISFSSNLSETAVERG